MSVNQKELERLLELKKQQESLQVLPKKEMQEKLKLENKYLEFLRMTSLEMEKELKKRGLEKKVGVDSPDLAAIIEDYKTLYDKEEELETKDGKTYLPFPSMEEAGTFFKDQAEKNRSFILVDEATNLVLAYSNGDGKLYNGNGTIYEGGEFQKSDQEFTNFRMPERESQNGMQR